HLVAAIFTDLVKKLTNEERNVVKSVVLIAGIYDLSEIPKTSINIPLKLNEDKANKLSVSKQTIANAYSTLFYIVAAENDSPEFKKPSVEFDKKLQAAGIRSTEIVIKNVDHFDVVELLTREDFELTKLILGLFK